MMNEDNNSEVEIDDDALALAAGGLSNHALNNLPSINVNNLNSILNYY